jgi:hypothetical protein
VETQEMWFPPAEPLSVAEYHTPYPKIAIGTFAGRAALQDVSWGGPRLLGLPGGKFNKQGTTELSVPGGMHPVFAILRPPTSVYLPGYGQVDIDTASETTADGYQVPVIRDLHAAMVFALDLETIKLFVEGPGIKDRLGQLRGDFDLLRWVPIKDVQIVSAFTGDVTRPRPTAEQEFYSHAVAGPLPTFFGGHGLAGPKTDKDLLRFSSTGEEVTTDRLVAWAKRSHPRGLDDATLLAPIFHSHEFSGSDDARERAAEALVLKLREKRQKGR